MTITIKVDADSMADSEILIILEMKRGSGRNGNPYSLREKPVQLLPNGKDVQVPRRARKRACNAVKEIKPIKKDKRHETVEEDIEDKEKEDTEDKDEEDSDDKDEGDTEEQTVVKTKEPPVAESSTETSDDSKSARGQQSLRLLTYPLEADKKPLVSLQAGDVRTLSPKQLLNDNMVDFWLQYMCQEKLCDIDRDRIHVFSSYFFTSLLWSKKIYKNRHQVSMHKNWTKSIDVFQKDFIVVPISMDSHWFLAVICFPYMVCKESDIELRQSNPGESEVVRKPCILIFDSMPKYIKRRSLIYRRLWNFLTTELKRQDESAEINFSAATMPGCVVEVPSQNNKSDCGLFLFKYFENFFTQPIKSFVFPIESQKQWFDKTEIKTMRNEVYQDILKLTRIYQPEQLHRVPSIEDFCKESKEEEKRDTEESEV